jgi:hypothetical protein
MGLEEHVMNINFPQTPLDLREHEPVLFTVIVDGKRVSVRIDWSTVASLSGGDTVDAIREHFRPRRHEVERAITSHLLARGVPATGAIVIGPDELRGI